MSCAASPDLTVLQFDRPDILLLLELARSGLSGDGTWPVASDRETIKHARDLLAELIAFVA